MPERIAVFVSSFNMLKQSFKAGAIIMFVPK